MKKTYYQTTRSKMVSQLVGLLIIAFWIALIAYWLPLLWLIEVVTAFYLFFFFLGILLNRYYGERLIVSEEGIEYYRSIFGIKVAWDRFKRIGYFWFREGLFIRNGYITTMSLIFPDWTVYGGFPFYVFVPLSSFADNWRDSDLGEQIKQHVPQLFIQENILKSSD
jgi:hypothetical protein